MQIRLKHINVNFFKKFTPRRPRNVLFRRYKPFPRQRDRSRERDRERVFFPCEGISNGFAQSCLFERVSSQNSQVMRILKCSSNEGKGQLIP